MDDVSNCRVGVINFPIGKTIDKQTALGIHEITQNKEFAKMSKLTGTITLSSGIQTAVADKSLVDSVEGAVVCLQMVVQVYRDS
jgi:hypothetical protein